MILFRRFNPSRESPNTFYSKKSSRYNRPAVTCYACQNPILPGIHHVQLSCGSGERRYHKHCFECAHCHVTMDPTAQPFCFATKRGESEEQPFHRQCYAGYFGWVCVVCDKTLPIKKTYDGEGLSETKFEYLKHPFFEEKMCPHHALPRDRCVDEKQSAFALTGNTDTGGGEIGSIRRCSVCHRFEPVSCPDKHFIDLGDSHTGRCVCLACCRTVVTTSQDALPLWEKVLDFFECLGLISTTDTLSGVSRQTMSSIPILIAGFEALNENSRVHSNGVHCGRSQIITRGLCLSEERNITALICLSGLPADLTASVLAHEATHAWIKLNPNFRYHSALPRKVEEGLAQLVSFLFLNDGLKPNIEESTPSEDDPNPSDSELRQYFKFCIETDQTLYGDGFRLAARAYAEMGIHELLNYIALNRDFPAFVTTCECQESTQGITSLI